MSKKVKKRELSKWMLAHEVSLSKTMLRNIRSLCDQRSRQLNHDLDVIHQLARKKRKTVRLMDYSNKLYAMSSDIEVIRSRLHSFEAQIDIYQNSLRYLRKVKKKQRTSDKNLTPYKSLRKINIK